MMMTWKKVLDGVVLTAGIAMISCSAIGATLVFLGKFALAGKFFAAMIIFFVLLAMVTSSEDVAAAKRAKRERRAKREGQGEYESGSSEYRRAIDRYNDECWNTNDGMEPPAIGDKR